MERKSIRFFEDREISCPLYNYEIGQTLYCSDDSSYQLSLEMSEEKAEKWKNRYCRKDWHNCKYAQDRAPEAHPSEQEKPPTVSGCPLYGEHEDRWIRCNHDETGKCICSVLFPDKGSLSRFMLEKCRSHFKTCALYTEAMRWKRKRMEAQERKP